jgi:exodeoxyribonuclease V alpha subunit
MLEINSEGEVLNALLKTVQALYERRENFQVLSPRHAGTLGVTNLNKRVRELLNPKDPVLGEMRLGQETVREGDRVMVSRNNYRYEIFNGDVGKIVRLDQKRRVVEVKIHGPPVMHVQIAFRDAPSHLRLAYCVTVHKSQGQEYDTILMPLVEGFRHQLQRNWLYTGITRAKRRVILLGHRKALHKAIENNRVDDRNTLFADRLLGV